MRTLLFGLAFITFLSCKKSEELPPVDYREAFAGVYDCKKSSRSFDDEDFSTDLEVIVIIDPESEDGVIVNDIVIPISEEGVFETNPIEGDYYELFFKDNTIRMSVNVVFPFGIALPCYIWGDKR